MDILSLLLKRTEYALGATVEDGWIKEAAKADTEEVFIILTENSLNQACNRDAKIALLDRYNLRAMFDLKNPYSNTNANFFLYVFSRKKSNLIQYGIYREILKKKNSRTDMLSLCDEYPESYFSYLENIEKFLAINVCPEDTDKQEFGVIESTLREARCWNPNRYNKTALKVKAGLKKEKTVMLCEVAAIHRPRPNEEGVHTNYCAMPNNWQYPVDYSKFREGILTDCVLQKGDIVFFENQKLFLVYDEPKVEIHTSPNFFIIRPKNVCPEYLYLYLKSETAQTIINAESVGTVIRRMRKVDLERLQVIVPNKDDSFYKNIFYSENFPIKDIVEINKTIFSTTVSEETLEDILDLELIEKLKVYKEDIRERILDEDLREINICFRHKAYKATLILAGSILEAVLIDWLSELHGKNYFEEEYIDRWGNKGTLAIYIRDIRYLKRPGWVKEAEKAYTIKEKRNQVHAKLCLNAEEINEDLCREVIGYLEDVLRTRNGKVNMKKLNR